VLTANISSRYLFLFALAALGMSCAYPNANPSDINSLYAGVLDQRRNHYKVKEGDTLAVRVYQANGDLAQQQLLILPDGRADAFFLPDFRFGGKTVPEIREEIEKAIVDEIEKPIVSVTVATRRDDIVYLTGYFQRPARMPLRTGDTVNDALAHGEGILITSDSNWVLLRRPFGHEPGFPARYRIDTNDESEEIFLLPGDQIDVPPNAFGYVVLYLREYVFGIFPTFIYSTTARLVI
jgi:protein involved in polysaccharide export with SLBB domain